MVLARPGAIAHFSGLEGGQESGVTGQDAEVPFRARRHDLVGLDAHEHPRRGGQLEQHYFVSPILRAFSRASSRVPTM